MQTPPRRSGANSLFRLPLLAAAALLCLAAPARAQICPLSVQSTAAGQDTATADSSSRNNRNDRGQRPERRRRPIPPGTVETASSTCGSDGAAPVVDGIDPASGTATSTAAQTVNISWHDEVALDQYGYYITLNGADVTSSFAHSYSTTWAHAVGTVTLSAGSNTLTIQVWDQAGNYATAAATYTYTPPPPPGVPPAAAAKPKGSLDPAQIAPGMVHPGSAIRRDMCLTISVAPGAAYECGDLRLVHALPSMRVLNAPRTAALIYNSQHAQPKPVFPFNLQMAVGSIPTAVRAVLWVSEVGQPAAVRAQKTWTAANWSSGLWRFAVSYDAALDSTNVYLYTLEVFTTIGGVESKVHTYTGDFAVVNRANSPFGAGWWVAGLERLVYVPGDGSFLRVGGDGSTQRYHWAAPGMWTAPVADRADTLWAAGGSFADGFHRKLPNGSVVWYNGDLRHSRTITRLGHTTSFRYDGPGRLDLITLPKPAGGTVDAQYVFGYDTGGRLEWVCAIVSGTSCRNTIMQYALGDRRVTGITGPDAFTVTFGYTGTGREVRGRTDRVGTGTTFTYDPGGRLRQAWRMVSGDTLIHTITATESQGLTTAQVAASTFTSYNGPRHPTDAVDISRIWVNRWGAPTRVRDPGLNTTYLTRSDSRFPALVTRVDYPNGRVVSAEYDARGNLKAQTDWSHSRTLANGQPAYSTTRYERTNTTWPDFVTQATTPEGEVSVTGYHANGSVAWQQPGTDASRQVRFDYNPLGQVEWVTLPGAPEAREHFEYDARGNLQYVTTPRGARTVFHNDQLGRTWKTESPIDGVYVVTTTATYDDADQVKTTTTSAPMLSGADPAAVQSVMVENWYDPEGNLRRLSRRSLGPDINDVGWITTRWEYDAAGRPIAEWAPDATPADSLDNPVDRTVYDLAGNVTEVHTRRKDQAGVPLVVRMRYDAMDRLIERVLPAVVYQPRNEGIPLHYRPEWYAHCSGAIMDRTYPGRPNSACGYRVEAEVQDFGYDNMGNLVRADNADAQVRRAYHPNGMITADTLRIRTTAGSDFTRHQYVLNYEYDLEGRRTQLTHPAQLAPSASQNTTSYSYDPLTGALQTVIDPLGNVFSHEYNVRGELKRRTFLGSGAENFLYDLDGGLWDHVTVLKFGDVWRSARIERTLGGRVRHVTNAAGRREAVTVAYSGLGHAVSTLTDIYRESDGQNTFDGSETFAYDALGNLHSQFSVDSIWGADSTRVRNRQRYSTFESGSGRLTELRNFAPRLRLEEFRYDPSGNLEFSTQKYYNGGSCDAGPKVDGDCEDRASFYAGDGTLAAAERRMRSGADGDNWWQTEFEEYRYDALGRRVWVRNRMECAAGMPSLAWPPVACRSTIRRTVWDGQQELWEIQMPGADTSSYLENDTDPLPVQPYIGVWPTTPPPCVWDASKFSRFDPNPHYGRVAYTYGHGVDQPLSLVRIGLNKYYPTMSLCGGGEPASFAPFAAVPLWDWRGQADGSAYTGGARQHCQVFAGVSRCVNAVEARSWYAYEVTGSASLEWHGTVVGGKRDATGTMYRRARYYDPQTGRFTQEDPIGLAGGLNLYGYAGGDPVNFADPSGNIPLPLITGGVGFVVGGAIGTGAYLLTTPRDEWTLGGVASYAGGGAVAGGVIGVGAGYFAPAASKAVLHRMGLGRMVRVTVGELTSADLGKVIGWGTGQTPKAIAQTQAVTRGVTRRTVQRWVNEGLTREWVEAQRDFYLRALATGGQKLLNGQLLPRLELMNRILELWP